MGYAPVPRFLYCVVFFRIADSDSGRSDIVQPMRAAFEKVPGRPDVSWHFHVRRAAQFPFEWHYHDEAELTLIISGAGQRFVADSVSRYEPGDFVLVGPNLPHTWRSDGENDEQVAVVCQFRPGFLGDGLLSAPEFADIRRLLDVAASGVSFGGDSESTFT